MNNIEPILNINNILQYQVFIFDFDGTIMDTEYLHCLSWNKSIQEFSTNHINNYISINDYFKYFHSLDPKYSRMYLEFKHDISCEYFEQIYKRKQDIYNEFIQTNNTLLIHGVTSLINILNKYEKEIVIVTNTSIKNINIYLEKFEILKTANKIYTKEDFHLKKPNPECYLKVVNDYHKLGYTKFIGFEDSLPGIHALYQVKSIIPVLLNNSYIYDYYYFNEIINKYPNLIITDRYNINKLNNDLKIYNHNINNNNLSIINGIIDNNINELLNNKDNMLYIINSISTILSNYNPNNHIYLSGMGKSGYICKKSASTWQSLSIKASYIDLPNLPHGDFGIFKDNDILLLISNGGNTTEVINILKYIKYNLNTKINIISIVANKNTEMEKYSNITYILNNITEADTINMTPSTSSLIFMLVLDAIGIFIRKDITKDEFQMYHPSGSLGKR